MSKICIISEQLELPFDEGIKSFAHNLIRELSKGDNVLAFSIRGDETDRRYIERLGVNRTFLSYYLCRRIRNFDPMVIAYIPSPCATIWSLMRAKILKLYARKAKIVMIALQPRTYSFVSGRLIPLLIPDLILVQSTGLSKQLSTFGCRTGIIPSGVDLERFCPTTEQRKLELRDKYGVDADKFVILHVGHINRKRNIQVLRELQGNSNEILIVASTCTNQEKSLVREFEMAGIKVITDYLENIEEIYQLSDCYVFPVASETGSIEVPLSVLEAMACNLPVVTTRYGGLSAMFSSEDDGLFFLNKLENLPRDVEKVKQLDHYGTRRKVEPYSWREVAKITLEFLQK